MKKNFVDSMGPYSYQVGQFTAQATGMTVEQIQSLVRDGIAQSWDYLHMRKQRDTALELLQEYPGPGKDMENWLYEVRGFLAAVNGK